MPETKGPNPLPDGLRFPQRPRTGHYTRLGGLEPATRRLSAPAGKFRMRRPTLVEGIEKYLASGMIRGIGPVYVQKLLRAFVIYLFYHYKTEKTRRREKRTCPSFLRMATALLRNARRISAPLCLICAKRQSDLRTVFALPDDPNGSDLLQTLQCAVLGIF